MDGRVPSLDLLLTPALRNTPCHPVFAKAVSLKCRTLLVVWLLEQLRPVAGDGLEEGFGILGRKEAVVGLALDAGGSCWLCSSSSPYGRIDLAVPGQPSQVSKFGSLFDFPKKLNRL